MQDNEIRKKIWIKEFQVQIACVIQGTDGSQGKMGNGAFLFSKGVSRVNGH